MKIFLSGLVVLLLAVGQIQAKVAENSRDSVHHEIAQGYQLERIVIISRHGVRSPTQSKYPLSQFAGQPWPLWPVEAGEMTPRGKALMTQMGHFYGQYFRQHHLLPSQGCPDRGQVYVWADTDQRTRMTGQAFVDGLAPGCHLPVEYQADLKKGDPLFHPVILGLCSPETSKAKAAVEQAAGGKIATLSEKYGKELNKMSEVLNFRQSRWCKQSIANNASCDFSRFEANKLEMDASGRELRLLGPVALSSTLAEIFLLQDAQGMPQPGWGRIITTDTWKALFKLHNVQFDLMSRTPYIARHNGTPVMNALYAALSTAIGKNAESRLKLPKNNKILFLAGHDTTVANIAGMLGMTWSLPDQFDNTPPDGGLLFELWKDPATGQYWVKVQMVYQTLTQLREQQTLDIHKNPAHRVALQPSGCDQEMCRWSRFSNLLQNSMLKHCL